jgi:hypothetical protein
VETPFGQRNDHTKAFLKLWDEIEAEIIDDIRKSLTRSSESLKALPGLPVILSSNVSTSDSKGSFCLVIGIPDVWIDEHGARYAMGRHDRQANHRLPGVRQTDCPINDHERDSSPSRSLLPTRPQRHTYSHCFLMRRFHAPVQSARNFPRLCFLMRQRFQHADIYRRPRSELYPFFPISILQAPKSAPNQRLS